MNIIGYADKFDVFFIEMDVGCDLLESVSWKKDGVFVAVTSKVKLNE